jgi:hypothetical protein
MVRVLRDIWEGGGGAEGGGVGVGRVDEGALGDVVGAGEWVEGEECGEERVGD